jgi:hypothetical protein
MPEQPASQSSAIVTSLSSGVHAMSIENILG